MYFSEDIHDKDIFDNPISPIGEYVARPTVKGIVIDNNGRIAILKARKHYGLPGGGVEEGEDLEQAFKREIKEELGSEIDKLEILGTSNQYRSKSMKHYQVAFFKASVVGDKGVPTTTQEDEIVGVELLWKSPEEVLKILEDQKDYNDEEEYAHCFNARSHYAAYREYHKSV